jgi:uncharacterized protein YbjT (DUF2867 family)
VSDFDVVTGAFSYTGRHIAEKLLGVGRRVRTLTGHPDRPHPLADRVEVFPYDFEDPRRMAAVMQGAGVLYNTYWERFGRRGAGFAPTIRNSRALIEAARLAGVSRIVHISISNPERRPDLPYFAGKLEVEQALKTSGIRFGIVRPTVVFGAGDVLFNNIAWLIRRFPFFALAGDGNYPVQPVHVEDVAELCVQSGAEADDLVVDAAGPETFSFRQLVSLVGEAVGRRGRLVGVPPLAVMTVSMIVGAITGDVLVTGEEIEGLMDGLAVSEQEPRGRIVFSEWVRRAGPELGISYASETERHYRRTGRSLEEAS